MGPFLGFCTNLSFFLGLIFLSWLFLAKVEIKFPMLLTSEWACPFERIVRCLYFWPFGLPWGGLYESPCSRPKKKKYIYCSHLKHLHCSYTVPSSLALSSSVFSPSALATWLLLVVVFFGCNPKFLFFQI